MDFSRMTALVTGASTGLGAHFAAALAARGCNLYLVARSGERLRALASQLAQAHGVVATAIVQDLAVADGPERAYAAATADGAAIDLLVNNAGCGTYGDFAALGAARENAEIALNVAAPVALCHAALPAMLARGHGAIINVASTAAFQPLPYLATYAATKAFVLHFSAALRAEVHGRGVRVLALCPGPTETAFFTTMGTRPAALGRLAAPEPVIIGALAALARDRECYIPGVGNALLAHIASALPRRLVAAAVAWRLRPR